MVPLKALTRRVCPLFFDGAYRCLGGSLGSGMAGSLIPTTQPLSMIEYGIGLGNGNGTLMMTGLGHISNLVISHLALVSIIGSRLHQRHVATTLLRTLHPSDLLICSLSTSKCFSNTLALWTQSGDSKRGLPFNCGVYHCP